MGNWVESTQDRDYCRDKGGKIKNQTNVGNKWDENTKKNSWQNKNRIRSQQVREFYGVQSIHEWMERRRREWDQHVIRMDAERLAKISRDNLPVGRRPPGRPKSRWSDFTPYENKRNRL